MTRRITCYVIIVTLIWGASTENEDNLRNIFKSNMTRNDFSNLLKSLIKLNEQRVNVLQRLYRLDDYSVLSEVLRTGNKKKGSGNLSNLYLVVLSKNQSDPSRRSMGFQVVDSVPSLDTGSFKFGRIRVNVSKTTNIKSVLQSSDGNPKNPMEKNNFEFIPGDNSKKQRAEYDIGDKPVKISLLGSNVQQRSGHAKKKQGTPETVVEVKNIDKPQGRFEIVSNGGIINGSQEVSEEDDDDSSEGINQMSSPELDIPLENDQNAKLTKLEDNMSGSHHPTNIEGDGDGSDENDHKIKFIPLNVEKSVEILDSKYLKLDRDGSKEDNRVKHSNINRGNSHKKGYSNKHNLNKDISIEIKHSKKRPKQILEKSDQNNHGKRPKINKEQSDENAHIKKHPLIDSDQSNGEHQGSKINEKIPDSSNENDHVLGLNLSKENTNENNHGNKYSKINKDKYDESYQSNKNAKIIRDKTAQNNLGKKFPKITTEPSDKKDHILTFNLHKPNNNENDRSKHFDINNETSNENYPGIKRPKIPKHISHEDDSNSKYPPLSLGISDEVMRGPKLLKTSKDGSRDNDYHKIRPKDARGSNEDMPGKGISLDHHNSNKNTEMGKDFARDNYDAIDKLSIENYGELGEGSINKPHNIIARDKPTPFDGKFEQPEAGPESRKNFQKCLNKKALKMCSKSCISAYKNVCRRLKCTSRSKRALKKECKRSCQKTFSSSKYSDESE